MTLRLFASALAARDYFPLMRWMIFTGVTVFGFAIAWRYGLFQLMMAQDQTRQLAAGVARRARDRHPRRHRR